MHKKAVDTCSFMLDCIPECYKTLKMREKSVFKRPNMLKYCLDRYATQEMCEKTNASCLLAIKCDPDLFVTPKMLEDLDNTLLFNDNLDLDKDDDNNNVIFFNYNSDNIVLSDIVIGLVKRKLNSFDTVDAADDFDSINLVKISSWCNKYKQQKTLKKEIDRDLMSISWYLERWWDCCVAEDEKKKRISFWDNLSGSKQYQKINSKDDRLMILVII